MPVDDAVGSTSTAPSPRVYASSPCWRDVEAKASSRRVDAQRHHERHELQRAEASRHAL